jgi:hypothetical protein
MGASTARLRIWPESEPLPAAYARPRDFDRFSTGDVVWIHGANAADFPPQEEQTMPLGMLALAAVAEPEVLEDTATIIREGVGEMAKAALPESAAAPNYASLREWTAAQEGPERPAEQEQEQHTELAL